MSCSTFSHITPEAHNFLQHAADKLQLSARGYLKVLKIAQTIADFDSVTEVKIEQISEALSFRQQDSWTNISQKPNTLF